VRSVLYGANPRSPLFPVKHEPMHGRLVGIAQLKVNQIGDQLTILLQIRVSNGHIVENSARFYSTLPANPRR
jgi:hypothetical protein